MAQGRPKPNKLETSALVTGYAMSRLGSRLHEALGWKTWKAAFAEAGSALGVPPNSIKGLRDEFDPIHENERRGWADRKMLPSRARVVEELREVGDAALIEMVRALLAHRYADVEDALEVLAEPTGVPAAAAERLLTGRLAEEYFLAHTPRLLGVDRKDVRDCRDLLCGFDFEVPRSVVEVKGLVGTSGEILFTDREWREAANRRQAYQLVVVGNVRDQPIARVVADPYAAIQPRCVYQRSVRAEWRARVTAVG